MDAGTSRSHDTLSGERERRSYFDVDYNEWCGEISSMIISMLRLMVMIFGTMLLGTTTEVDIAFVFRFIAIIFAQVHAKPAANTHEKDIELSYPSNAFLAIDDDEVAKGATVGKIGSFKEIKGHGKRLSRVVKSKRNRKNIDTKRKLDKKVASAEGAVKAAFVLPNITPKDGKSIEPQEHQELEKQSNCRVMECKTKSENIESRRKHRVTRTNSELVEPFEDPEREFRRLLRERRKTYAGAGDLNNPNTSKLPGPAAVSSSTQRSHTMVLRRRK